MENQPLLHETHDLLGRISVHQDFFWFSSLLIWSLALVVWWRHPERKGVWVWVPGAAGATIATALVQFGMFNPTFDIFLERLIPGTVADYHPALINPYWLGDVLIGGAFAAMAAVWGWVAFGRTNRSRWRLLAVIVPAAVAGLHTVEPLRGSAGLVGLALVAGAFLWPVVRPSPAARLGLALAAILPLLSTVGPVAMAWGLGQRFGPPTPAGLVAATVQALLGGWVMARLLFELRARLRADSHVAFRRDVRRFGAGALLLLVVGLVFGIQTGRDNRREIQQNRLRTTAAHAHVFDPALLAPLVSPDFRIDWKSAAGEPAPAHSSYLASGKADPARHRLAEVVVATPFLKEARLLLLRDGWLVAALSTDAPAGQVEVLRRATAEDLARWDKKEPYVEESPVPEIGYNYYCRAPIVDADGRMLGWLDCVRSEYFLSMERRWRAAPFLITALGLVLLTLVVVQRQSAREREKALRAASVSAEASRIKTTFLANVSHELRTPLQSILGYSELLLADQTDEKNRTRLAALRQQGELMTRLINDLIDLSAVEAGSFQLTVQPVAPGELVLQTVESLRPRAEGKGLALQVEIDGGVPAWVSVDGGRLRQVLVNLVGNAIKFTDRGGVTVSLWASVAPDGGTQLELAVRDTGPGIPVDRQGRLFVPFSRLAQTAAKEGSGLGLALSAALCRAMGGELGITSDGATGSCFTATVGTPVTDAPGIIVSPETVRPAMAPRVLVVDDNRLVRELFVSALDARGARCTEAASGAAGLARAAEKPDVLVLDLALPDGDGTDFIPRFRALIPGLRIIGVSAHAGERDRERALAAGMNAFLVKPVALDVLWAAVAGAVRTPTPPVAFFDVPAALRDRLRAEFAREIPARRAGLAAAMQAGDWPEVRAAAHYLRNSALVVQAGPLFEACTGLETAAAAADPVAAAAWWQRCAAALDAPLTV